VEIARIFSPALIVIGGFAGTGKTEISKRLAIELGIPRLGSDTIGRTIKNSAGIAKGAVKAHWIAYDVLFSLCEEFIQSGVSVVLDLTMGWDFQWEQIDGIMRRHPEVSFLPIVLRCPYRTCIERTRDRHEAAPEQYDPPQVYETEPKQRSIWEYLAHLERPDVCFVSADRPHSEVYDQVREHVSAALA
jgi:predicted kinase